MAEKKQASAVLTATGAAVMVVILLAVIAYIWTGEWQAPLTGAVCAAIVLVIGSAADLIIRRGR